MYRVVPALMYHMIQFEHQKLNLHMSRKLNILLFTKHMVCHRKREFNAWEEMEDKNNVRLVFMKSTKFLGSKVLWPKSKVTKHSYRSFMVELSMPSNLGKTVPQKKSDLYFIFRLWSSSQAFWWLQWCRFEECLHWSRWAYRPNWKWAYWYTAVRL